AAAGVALRPRPFRPVLRGLLLTGEGPRYLRGELAPGGQEPSQASAEPLWWPPAKIVGRYLAPFLARVVGMGDRSESESEAGLAVGVGRDRGVAENRRDRVLEAALDDVLRESGAGTVGDVMT